VPFYPLFRVSSSLHVCIFFAVEVSHEFNFGVSSRRVPFAEKGRIETLLLETPISHNSERNSPLPTTNRHQYTLYTGTRGTR
jgi:hypothetical protein